MLLAGLSCPGAERRQRTCFPERSAAHGVWHDARGDSTATFASVAFDDTFRLIADTLYAIAVPTPRERASRDQAALNCS